MKENGLPSAVVVLAVPNVNAPDVEALNLNPALAAVVTV